MLEVKFYDTVDDALLKFAVIISQSSMDTIADAATFFGKEIEKKNLRESNVRIRSSTDL